MHHLLIADGFWVFMPWLVAVALWWIREWRVQ